MWYNCPYLNTQVELTSERLEHIINRHSDVAPLLVHLAEVLESPDEIRTIQCDPETLIFYRPYHVLGEKNLAVVVK